MKKRVDGARRGPKATRRAIISAGAAAGAVSFAGSARATGSGDITWLSAWRIREMIIDRAISARAVTEHFLSRIRKLNPQLHAFTSVDESAAREAADRADADLKHGKKPGLLHGIPLAVKDNLWAKGLPSSAGSLIFAKFRPSIDDTVVERLRAAGAIVVGKTNMPEYAAWCRSRTYMAGEAMNPWDRRRISGASSGGSAVAVAAGMVPAAVGTDGGGSIRIPSALCGIVGLYPTLGRVPDYGGFHCSPYGSPGPMTRTVLDAAVIEHVIAGPDSRLRSSLAEPAPDVMAGLYSGVAGLRVAWSPAFGRIAVDPLVVTSARKATEALSRAGAIVEEIPDVIAHPWGDGSFMAPLQRALAAGEIPPDPMGEAPEIRDAESWLVASSVEGKTCYEVAAFRELLTRYHDLLTPPQRLLARVGQGSAPMPSPQELRAAMDRIFTRHDVLCSPTMLVTAPIAPPGWASAYPNFFMGTDFTFIANSTGCPAATVPCGLANGLPVGFQIIGRPGDEPTVLRVAQAVETALPPLPKPPVERV